MGSINGLKNIHATSIQNAGQFYLGNNLDSGTAGQVIISAGPQQAALWGSNSATLPGALTMGTNLSLASGNASFDGTTADTINADDLSITGGNGISVVGGTEIVTDNDNITINNTGGTGQKNQVLKVPNALTFTGASTGTFDGSSALSINLTNTDTQLNLTGALPIVINDLGGLNKQVDIDIDSNTMGVSGGELEVLKVPNTLTFTGYATGSFDGSSSLSINLVDTDTTYTGTVPIAVSAGNAISLAYDGDTLDLDGADLAVQKVPNVMTAGTNISMVNTDDGASASSYDGSEPITITAASSGTTYDGGTNINIDTSTNPDEINLDTSITGQTGITFLNNGASTNLTGSNYPNKPTTATNLDLSSATNIFPLFVGGSEILKSMSYIDNSSQNFNRIYNTANEFFFSGSQDSGSDTLEIDFTATSTTGYCEYGFYANSLNPGLVFCVGIAAATGGTSPLSTTLTSSPVAIDAYKLGLFDGTTTAYSLKEILDFTSYENTYITSKFFFNNLTVGTRYRMALYGRCFSSGSIYINAGGKNTTGFASRSFHQPAFMKFYEYDSSMGGARTTGGGGGGGGGK